MGRGCVLQSPKLARSTRLRGTYPIAGIGWSDHWAFWEADYPAIMVTDTAPFRFPHYHLTSDLPDTIDYERMARVVVGIERVVEGLAAR